MENLSSRSNLLSPLVLIKIVLVVVIDVPRTGM